MWLAEVTINIYFNFIVNVAMAPQLNPSGTMRAGSPTDKHSCYDVRGIPQDLKIKIDRSHYKLYTEAYGIPILG